MDSRTITIGLLLASVAILVTWDLYVATNRAPGDTISEVLLDWARRVAFIPYAAGVLVGHLFWPASGMVPIDWVLASIALLVVGVVGTCLQFIARISMNGRVAISPMIHVTLGILMGHWIWPQW